MLRTFVLLCCLVACKGKTVVPAAAGSGSAAAPSPARDAAVASTQPTLSAEGGLSTLGKFDWQGNEYEIAVRLQNALRIPGVTVDFTEMDVPGEADHRVGYWSARINNHEIMKLLRVFYGGRPAPVAVIVTTPDVQTADGIKVGDTVATLLAKYPDLACRPDDIGFAVHADTVCHSAAHMQLYYFLDPDTVTPETHDPSMFPTAKIQWIGHQFQ